MGGNTGTKNRGGEQELRDFRLHDIFFLKNMFRYSEPVKLV
jgi:hypothetical protein